MIDREERIERRLRRTPAESGGGQRSTGGWDGAAVEALPVTESEHVQRRQHWEYNTLRCKLRINVARLLHDIYIQLSLSVNHGCSPPSRARLAVPFEEAVRCVAAEKPRVTRSKTFGIETPTVQICISTIFLGPHGRCVSVSISPATEKHWRFLASLRTR